MITRHIGMITVTVLGCGYTLKIICGGAPIREQAKLIHVGRPGDVREQ